MLRKFMTVMALALSVSQAASAQITTYVAPPRPDVPTVQQIATADSVRRDSVAQVAVTNMKVWVDSAAGVAIPEYVGDSANSVNDPGRPVTTTFSEGSVAPDTASPLPLLALLGFVSLGLGTLLLSSRRG